MLVTSEYMFDSKPTQSIIKIVWADCVDQDGGVSATGER
jgi:hypothetical protein